MSIVADPSHHGTEVKLYNLQFKNSLATLIATKVTQHFNLTMIEE